VFSPLSCATTTILARQTHATRPPDVFPLLSTATTEILGNFPSFLPLQPFLSILPHNKKPLPNQTSISANNYIAKHCFFPPYPPSHVYSSFSSFLALSTCASSVVVSTSEGIVMIAMRAQSTCAPRTEDASTRGNIIFNRILLFLF
jgi:hypothetical protein